MQLQIEKLVYGGSGLARTEQGVVFVPRTAPGDVVEAEIVERKKDYSIARLTQILEPSPDRQEPYCPNYETAGCCHWQHIRYDRQVDYKEATLRESLQRGAKLEWKDDIDFKGDAKRPVLILDEVIRNQGDGTVPARGAKVEGLDGHFTVKKDHGGIPSFPDTHPILTQLRKKINNEDGKESAVKNITSYANMKLKEVQLWPDSGSVFKALKDGIFSFFVRPDENKIKAREELRGNTKEMLKWAHVNVVVAEGTEKEEHFYLVINDYKLIEAGAGKIKPGTAIVKVDSFETLNDIISGKKRMRDALQDGSVSFKGTGLVNGFKLKLFKWFGKYA